MRAINVRRSALRGSAVLAALFQAQAALAQAGPPIPPTGAGVADDIVVTATRREEVASKVPVAVSVLSGEKLDALNSGGLDIKFLSAKVPSLLAESSFGRVYPRFFIRGLGSTDFAPDAEHPVSLVYDDVVIDNAFLQAFPAFDLSDVEVLKGPQGTLFGRNTPAGVVKLTSAKPTDTFTGHALVGVGSYGTLNIDTAVSGPIGDGWAFRLSANLQRRGAWLDNDYAGTHYARNLEGYADAAGRGQIAYRSGDFDALLNVHGRYLDGTSTVFRANILAAGTNDFVPGFKYKNVSLDGDNQQIARTWGTNLHLNYLVDDIGTLTSITSFESGYVYYRGDLDGGYGSAFTPPSGPGFIPFATEEGGPSRPHEFQQEVRFVSNPLDGWHLQGGLYYFHSSLANTTLYFNPDGSRQSSDAATYRNESLGAYGSAEYTLSERLTLRGGLRYSRDRRRTVAVDAGGLTARASKGKVSWDVGATYEIEPAAVLYVRAAEGYLAPALKVDTTGGGGISTARAQTTYSYEGGVKGSGRGFSYALDGYYWNTVNMQLTGVGGISNATVLLNAKKVIGYGAEAEVSWKPSARLSLSGGASYNFTQIHDKGLAVAPCGGGCTLLDPRDDNGNALIDGNRLPQAPRVIVQGTARYGVPLGADRELYVLTDWSYRSKIAFFLYDSIEFTGKPATEGGIRLGYGSVDRKWDAAFFVRNVLNQVRAVGGIDFNNLTAYINEPRIFGMQVAYKF